MKTANAFAEELVSFFRGSALKFKTESEFAFALAGLIRRERVNRGWSQEDLAFAARKYSDLDWNRSTVVSIELGRRQLQATELLLLPSAFVYHRDPVPDTRERALRCLAEQKAANKLGVDLVSLVGACFALWGRGLTVERDVRVLGLTGDRRALRGHVTRSLLVELQTYLKPGV